MRVWVFTLCQSLNHSYLHQYWSKSLALFCNISEYIMRLLGNHLRVFMLEITNATSKSAFFRLDSVFHPNSCISQPILVQIVSCLLHHGTGHGNVVPNVWARVYDTNFCGYLKKRVFPDLSCVQSEIHSYLTSHCSKSLVLFWIILGVSGWSFQISERAFTTKTDAAMSESTFLVNTMCLIQCSVDISPHIAPNR